MTIRHPRRKDEAHLDFILVVRPGVARLGPPRRGVVGSGEARLGTASHG